MYKVHGHVANSFGIAARKSLATATIAVGDLLKWDASGDGVTPATAGILPHLIAGVAQNAGGSGDTIYFIPWVDGLLVEVNYQTGTPGVADPVQIYDKVNCNVFSNGTYLGRVDEVLNATTKYVRIMVDKSMTKNVTT